MTTWVEILVPILIGEIIGLGGLIWKLATAYGELKKADHNNKVDINQLGQSVRRTDRLSWERMDNIEEYLENLPTDPPFRRKSLNLFDSPSN